MEVVGTRLERDPDVRSTPSQLRQGIAAVDREFLYGLNRRQNSLIGAGRRDLGVINSIQSKIIDRTGPQTVSVNAHGNARVVGNVDRVGLCVGNGDTGHKRGEVKHGSVDGWKFSDLPS